MLSALRFTARPDPILVPDAAPTFTDPLTGEPTAWMAKDVFNPAAIVRKGKVHLLFRAEDHRPNVAGTSRLGLAVSEDGERYRVEPEPVLFPDHDVMRRYEWPGGVEDPRVVETEDPESGKRGYLMTYTAFDGAMARLATATSPDLRTWTKHGLAFSGAYEHRWSKSGALVCRMGESAPVATRIGGVYWMIWGEGDLYAATSENLTDWTPIEYEANANSLLHHDGERWHAAHLPGTPAPAPIARPRRGRYDSALVEPGPFALLTTEGIELIVNGASGDPRTYAPGLILLDPEDPTAVLRRDTEPFLRPERLHELAGQVPSVLFVNGLCRHNGRWLLPYGGGDSLIGLAAANDAVAGESG